MLCLFLLAFHFEFKPPTPMEEVEQLMAFGQYNNAYRRITAMIDKMKPKIDSSLYLLRAQCAFHEVMVKECIADCGTVINNKGSSMEDVRKALTFRANAQLLSGDFDAAQKDARSANDKTTLAKIQKAKKLPMIIESQFESGQIDSAKQSLQDFLRICPKATKYRLMRADIAWMEGDEVVFEEMTRGEPLNESKMLYRRGLVLLCADQANEAKPLLKEAFSMKKHPQDTQAALTAAEDVSKFMDKIERYLKANDSKNAWISINRTMTAAHSVCKNSTQLSQRVNVYYVRYLRMINETEKSLEILNEMIEQFPGNLDLRLERGELALEKNEYDDAMFDFNFVVSEDPRNVRAQKNLEKAVEMKQKATRVDHYAVLGVPQDAGLSEIKDAYRKKVREWHPDQFSDKTKKKKAESMMKQVNSAYEVLSDSKKRKIYDAGMDPDDPTAEQQFNMGGFGFDPFGFGEGQHIEFEGNPFGFGQEAQHIEFEGNPFEFLFGQGAGVTQFEFPF